MPQPRSGDTEVKTHTRIECRRNRRWFVPSLRDSDSLPHCWPSAEALG